MNQEINELVLFQNTFVEFFEFYYYNNTYNVCVYNSMLNDAKL